MVLIGVPEWNWPGLEDVFMFEPNGQKGFLFHHTSQQFHKKKYVDSFGL